MIIKATNMKPAGEVLKTRSARFWMGRDGIVRATLLVSAGDLSLPDVNDNVAAVIRASGGVTRPMLSNLRHSRGVSKAHRDYFSGEEAASVILAGVGLISSPLSRMIDNVFMQINSPSYPVRMFTSEEQALDLLKGFLS